MAQVRRFSDTDVEHLIDRAAAAWEELTDVEREIDGWRLEDQLVFTEEWPLEEERLRRLAVLAQTGSLTDDQCSRYAELLKLVARQRPIIDRLLRS